MIYAYIRAGQQDLSSIRSQRASIRKVAVEQGQPCHIYVEYEPVPHECGQKQFHRLWKDMEQDTSPTIILWVEDLRHLPLNEVDLDYFVQSIQEQGVLLWVKGFFPDEPARQRRLIREVHIDHIPNRMSSILHQYRVLADGNYASPSYHK